MRKPGTKKFDKIPFILCLGAWALSGLACGGGGNDVFDSSNLLGGGMQVGEVRALIFNENKVAKTSFTELSGEEEFSFLVFAANPQAISHSVQIQSLNLSADKALQWLESEAPAPLHLDEADDPTALAHQQLREEEGKWVGQEPYSPGVDGISAKSLATGGACGNGGVNLKVLTSLANTNLYTQVCAIPVRTTGNAIYYVDQSVLSEIPNGSLNGLIDGFEAQIPIERGLFGDESDVDQNSTLSVLFSPAVNRLGAEAGGFVTGFFYGGDLFPAQGNSPSNQGEILYVCVPDPKGTWGVPLPLEFWMSNIAPAVLPHEFQHMISFNQKVIQQGVAPEEPWLNEGISHFVEDLQPVPGINPGSIGVGNLQAMFSKTGNENPSRVSLYLHSPQSNPFTAGIALAQRGGTYLALKYFFEQANLGRYPGAANGQELLQKLLQSPKRGVDNLAGSMGWEFKDLLLDFFAALAVSSTEISADPRYKFQGICLTCEQDDNRGTKLSGVKTVPLSGTTGNGNIASPGGIFFKSDGESLTRAGQGLSFIASPDMIPGGAVIRLR